MDEAEPIQNGQLHCINNVHIPVGVCESQMNQAAGMSLILVATRVCRVP
jgi:hypothetical protein